VTKLPINDIENSESTNEKFESSNSEEKNIPAKNNAEESITLEEIHTSHKHIKSVSASGKIRYDTKNHHRHHHSKSKRKHSHGSSKKSKGRTLKRILIGILIFLLIAVIGLFAAYNISRYLGKKALLKNISNASIDTIDGAESDDDGWIIYYKGHKYRFNDNLISIVFMGIDKSDLDSQLIGTSGQADAIYIFTYDTETEKCSLIPVSRETMTDVRLYSASGAEMELEKMQLCLAYAYGDGKETSCENTLASLSRIFYNIPFSAYVSLNWDSIAPLNDAINGVEVTALENVQTESSMIYKNQTVTLMGKDAWSYVKYRDTSRLDSNIDRLNRQKQYINAYISKLIPMAKKDFSVATGLISTANQYMYSNISTNQLVYIVSEILPTVYSAKDFDFVTIDGKIKQGETYAEFYPDETSLYESILKVFYTKIS
jgi:anionic cell wall polymer biosynthesis LytR-Cps2A-Psr (LCP) family protein